MIDIDNKVKNVQSAQSTGQTRTACRRATSHRANRHRVQARNIAVRLSHGDGDSMFGSLEDIRIHTHLASVAAQTFSVTRCLRCCSSYYATCMWDVFVYLVGGCVGWWVGVAGDCVAVRVAGVVAGPMLPGHGRNRMEQPGWECSPVCVCVHAGWRNSRSE